MYILDCLLVPMCMSMLVTTLLSYSQITQVEGKLTTGLQLNQIRPVEIFRRFGTQFKTTNQPSIQYSRPQVLFLEMKHTKRSWRSFRSLSAGTRLDSVSWDKLLRTNHPNTLGTLTAVQAVFCSDEA